MIAVVLLNVGLLTFRPGLEATESICARCAKPRIQRRHGFLTGLFLSDSDETVDSFLSRRIEPFSPPHEHRWLLHHRRCEPLDGEEFVLESSAHGRDCENLLKSLSNNLSTKSAAEIQRALRSIGECEAGETARIRDSLNAEGFEVRFRMATD